MTRELNPNPDIDEVEEVTFREKAIHRLTTEHSDLPPERTDRWLELLNEECDGDRVWAAKCRVMATTAVWTMMDVRDIRKRGGLRYGAEE